MNSDDFEITVSDVSDVEATVTVRYRPAANNSSTSVRGMLRGPYCEVMRTLVAEFEFRAVDGEPGVAVARVVDPCLWSRDLPHLYEVEVKVYCGEQEVAEFQGPIGLQHTGGSTSSI